MEGLDKGNAEGVESNVEEVGHRTKKDFPPKKKQGEYIDSFQ